MNPIIRWIHTTKYVDITTGEEITKSNASRNYIIIKNKKYVTFNQSKTIGTVEHTKECQRDPQGKLFTDL